MCAGLYGHPVSFDQKFRKSKLTHAMNKMPVRIIMANRGRTQKFRNLSEPDTQKLAVNMQVVPNCRGILCRKIGGSETKVETSVLL